MRIGFYIIPALWLAWGLYWIVAGRNVKAARRTDSRLSRALYVIPIFAAVMLFFFRRLWGGWLSERFLPWSIDIYWTGVLVLVAGLVFAVWARRTIGRNWSGTVMLKEDHELIRSGPYRLVRHPIYTGILLGFVGTAIALGQWRGLIALALVTGSFVYKLRIEERFMTEAFPDQYPAYRAKTARLIPFVY